MPALLLLMSACADGPSEPELTDDLRVQEAALRFMTELEWNSYLEFVTYAGTAGIPRDSSFAELTAVPERLYRRLQDIGHPVRPFAELAGWVRHPDFSGPGLMLWVGTPTFAGNRDAIVYAGYYIGPLGSAGYLLRLEKPGDSWQTASFRLMWIS